VVRHGVGERRERQTVGLDREQLGERIEVDLEPARAVELGHEATVGDRREVADRERARDLGGAPGERGQTGGDERPDPRRLVAAERLDLAERRGVLQRLDPGVDDLGERARRTGSRGRIGGSGQRSSRYSRIASDWVSVILVPSSSVTSSVGTCDIGFLTR
jgi:hypothetical protein